VIGLAVLDPAVVGEPANLATLGNLAGVVFYPVLNITNRSEQIVGVLLMAAVPAGLLTVPFIENINKFQILSDVLSRRPSS
jgi:cytochrome b6-f complex subunit 4